jgi:hypothetical protein
MIITNPGNHGPAQYHTVGRTLELGRFTIVPKTFDLIADLFLGAFGSDVRRRMEKVFPSERDLYTRMFLATKGTQELFDAISDATEAAAAEKEQAREKKLATAPDSIHEQVQILKWRDEDRAGQECADRAWHILQGMTFALADPDIADRNYKAARADAERRQRANLISTAELNAECDSLAEDLDADDKKLERLAATYRGRLAGAFIGHWDHPCAFGIRGLHYVLTGRNII